MKYFFLLLMMSSPAFAAINLEEAFRAARENMESIKRAKHIVDQAQERKVQARAAMLPTIAGVGNETRIDAPDAAPVNRAFILTRQYTAALRLQQPLIRGGAVSGLELAKDGILLSQFQKNATEVNLYQLIINAYFQLHIAQLDLMNLQELMRLSEERVKEIRSRTAVGRSRRGELVQAEAQLLAAQTQFEQGDISFIQAKENFEFFTGLKTIDIAPPALLPRELPALATYLEKLRTRPDLLADRQQVAMAEKRIDIAKGGHYPQLDLVSNYYFDRTGILATSEWDAAVVVNIPIFQGGAVQSQVRESTHQKRIEELTYRQNLRNAETNLSVLYQNYRLMLGQIDTLKKAVKKAQEAYRLNARDYQHGQVTNLDVLQSLNIYIETKRAYDNLQAQAHMTYKTLEATAGVLP